MGNKSKEVQEKSMSNDPYCIVRFSLLSDTWHQTVLDTDSRPKSVDVAIEKALRQADTRTAVLWPYVYIAQNNYICANVSGPDMVGHSVAFANDFFQTYKPVHLDETLGDSI